MFAGLGAGRLFDYQLVLRTVTITTLTALLWGGGVLILYERFGIIIGLIAPTIALIGSFSAVESITGLDARRQRAFIHNTFSLYLPPSFVQQLVDDPSKLVLGGERRDMSLLFTDIHGFTTMAEGLDSKDVGRVLNSYLDGMTAAVQKHQGTIDKFIGEQSRAVERAARRRRLRPPRCGLRPRHGQVTSFRVKMNPERASSASPAEGACRRTTAVGNSAHDRFSYRLRATR